MTDIDRKLNALIKSIEKDFYDKKKKVIIEFEKLENRKKIDYNKIKSKLSSLKGEELKLRGFNKKLNKELRVISKKLNSLREEKALDEKKMLEINKIKKEYPLIIKGIASLGTEKKELVSKVRDKKQLIRRLEKDIEKERVKADKLRRILSNIDTSQKEVIAKRINKKV